MRVGRWTLFWVLVIALLVLVELAEITRLFTLPLAIAFLDPYTFLFSLVLITILALVGAVFVGFYLSSRIYSSRGFTPFEQEMLHMREEVGELRRELRALHAELGATAPAAPASGGARDDPSETRPEGPR